MKASAIRRILAKSKRPRRKTKGPRPPLTKKQRRIVREKTGGVCHLCGGDLDRRWQVDHVVPLSRGGESKPENYLPICKECNRIRWSYRPQVLRLIVRLGVIAKQEIRHKTEPGERLLKLAARHKG